MIALLLLALVACSHASSCTFSLLPDVDQPVSEHQWQVLLKSGQFGSAGAADECVLLPDMQYCRIAIDFAVVLGVGNGRRQDWGVCVPRSCTRRQVADNLIPSIHKALGNLSRPVATAAPGAALPPGFFSIECVPDVVERTAALDKWTPGGSAVIAFAALFGALGAIATCVAAVRRSRERSIEYGSDSGERQPLIDTLNDDDASDDDDELVMAAAGAAAMAEPAATHGSYVHAFDWSHALSSLFADSQPELRVGDGLRTLAMFSITLGHTYSYFGAFIFQRSAPLGTAAAVRAAPWWYAVVAMAVRSVDTFFFLSGLLVCYIMTKRWLANRRRPMLTLAQYALAIVRRYARLTPFYAFWLFAYVYVMPMFLFGPRVAADYNNYMVPKCSAGRWWPNLLYVANWTPGFNAMCMGWSWYLAADYQMLIAVMPPLVLSYAVLAKRGAQHRHWLFVGVPLVAVAVVISLALVFGGNLTSNPRNQGPGYWSEVYPQFYTRMAPYVIGGCLGCVLAARAHERGPAEAQSPSQQCSISSAHRNRPRTVLLGHTLAMLTLLVCLGCLAATVLLPLGNIKPPRAVEVFDMTLTNVVWALALAWVVHSAACGQLPVAVQAMLEWKGFAVMGRLGLNVYLLHPTIIQGVAMNNARPLEFDGFVVACEWIGITLIAYFLAGLIYVCIEHPLRHVSDMLLKPKPSSAAVTARAATPLRTSTSAKAASAAPPLAAE